MEAVKMALFEVANGMLDFRTVVSGQSVHEWLVTRWSFSLCAKSYLGHHQAGFEIRHLLQAVKTCTRFIRYLLDRV